MQQAKRILLIGLGRWGANHLRVLQSMPIELFVAEHGPDRLNSSGVSQNHRSAEAHSLFPVIDAAVVVTPAPTHFEICRDLLEGGKDVFVEKPISLKSAQAKEAGYHLPGKMRELTIVGKDSSAVCDYNVAQYKIKTFENRHVGNGAEIKAMEGAMHQLEFPPEERLRAELAAFLDAIETRSRPLVDGADGMEAVRVVEGAVESARTGKWIDISR